MCVGGSQWSQRAQSEELCARLAHARRVRVERDRGKGREDAFRESSRLPLTNAPSFSYSLVLQSHSPGDGKGKEDERCYGNREWKCLESLSSRVEMRSCFVVQRVSQRDLRGNFSFWYFSGRGTLNRGVVMR